MSIYTSKICALEYRPYCCVPGLLGQFLENLQIDHTNKVAIKNLKEDL